MLKSSLKIAFSLFSMPYFALYFKANMENIQEVLFPVDHCWKIDFACPDLGSVRENVSICVLDEVDTSDGRGTCNLLLKLDGSRAAQVSLTEVKKVTSRVYTAEMSGSFQPIIAFDCRGVEPIKWRPTGYYNATSSSGGIFEEVDLSEGDWFEYDEAGQFSVGVNDIEWRFQKIAAK